MKALLSLLLLVTVACGDDGAATTTAGVVVVIEVTEAGGLALTVAGVPVEVGSRLNVDLGATVRLVARLDHDDEVHVHGYDASLEAATGEEAVLEFVADVPGVFEVEFEGSGTVLFELAVA